MKPMTFIQPADVEKIAGIFPGRFVFVLVRDHGTGLGDAAFTAETPDDLRLGASLIDAITGKTPAAGRN